ncbi:hypothetical protein [Pseudomonas viridiflava]|uniref:hypothetical protein n=1 Tax=Pseudomonas viridiflava TaxID=33069 RepID=UPI000F0594BF|nr:hypothetical protein [Pseudomonas viridiflava]
MPHDKRTNRGNNLNDPEQSPADIADHQQRTRESRTEEAQTGNQQDDQGHAPKVPTQPDTDKLKP